MNQAAFDLQDLVDQHQEAGERYYEFLRSPDLNCGLYILPAGDIDPQQPHDEDEVYYVISGRGQFIAGGDDQEVGPGSILYVKKEIEHRFHTIVEDLNILVFFASGT